MSGGDSAPPPSPSSSSSLPPTLTPFISPSGVGGVRFPIYATIQGVNSPLIYSPTLFGQSVLPWRPLVTTPTTAGAPPTNNPAASGSQALPPTSSSTSSIVTGYAAATSFAQLPGGLMYPLNMPFVMQTDTPKKVEGATAAGSKRRGDATSADSDDAKRARVVATATGVPQSAGSLSPSPQPPLLRPTPHRSPVIKYNLLPYNIGGATVVAGASPGQQATPTSLTQTVILSIAPNTSTGAACGSTRLSPHSTLVQATPPSSTPSTPPFLPLLTPSLSSSSLPPNLLVTLLRCFGPLQVPSSIPAHQLVTSDLLSDLYRSSYHTTSELSGNLSPESCALLTIAYLSSLRRGERLCVESLHTMLKYARTGESEWLQYYKRHKKMSESTFVQSQLMHLSRISVYPALGRVRVMISNEHLAQGITLTIKNLAQLVTMTTEALPDFVVVLAVRGNVGVEFCVLVLEPLLSQLLLRQQKNRWRRLAHGALKKSVAGSVTVETTPGGNPSSLATTEIKIEKQLLMLLRRAQRRLKGEVCIPFQEPGNRNETVPQSRAEVMIPTTLHVIEHKPGGPYSDQVNVAMHLMQRITGSAGVKLVNFRTLDFCVLCPPGVNFVRGVRRGLVEGGLGELVREGEGGGALDDRVIRCCEEDYGKFSKFLNEIHTNQETLYLVIVEHADITSSLAGSVVDNGSHGNGSSKASCYGEHKILLGQPNVVMLYLTSLPYRLVTNRFLVSAANEIHWPVREPRSEAGGGGGGVGGERGGEVEFCCVGGLPGATVVKGAGPGGVVVSEDERMEEEFHSLATQLCPAADISLIRHHLLLNDYISALVSLGSAHCTGSPAHPDTETIVRGLTQDPLLRSRGHGPLLLIRSHDSHMGQQFFSKLKAARDALGLQFRFEMILDSGNESLTLSPHFLRRVRNKTREKKDSGVYGNGCLGDSIDGCHGDDEEGSHVTYSDLENVPCVLVMVGEERAHVSLPSSLRWVDLRLLYPTDITRTVYESELAWANGYLPPSPSPSPSLLLLSSHLGQSNLTTNSDNKETAGSHQSDEQEVMSLSESHRPHPPTTPLSSSSSRRSSVTDSVTMATGDGERGGRERGVGGGVVEWHPGTTAHETTTVESGVGVVRSDDEEEEVIDVSDLPSQTPPTVTMTTTVVIDPPEDQLETTQRQGGSGGGVWSYSHSSILHQNRTETDTPPANNSQHPVPTPAPIELFADLSDSESDSDDEGEPPAITRTCLLPRPFYHIWTSRNMQQALLLPPATGVEWASPSSKHSRSSGSHGNTTATGGASNGGTSSSGGTVEKARRPPLFDPDPTHQTSYYRKWSKPCNSVTKKALDMLLRATISGTKRRFLLTGPSQVGKTGAWQLLVRLLHDHLRSSHSVTVENPPLQHSILLQENSPPEPSSSVVGTHSRVVAPGYLKLLYQELLGNDKKPFVNLPPSPVTTAPTQTTPPTPSTTILTLSPFAAHDSRHSCATCSENSKPSTSLYVLSQYLPIDGIMLRWYIPPGLMKYCIIDEEQQILLRLCLPSVQEKQDGNQFDGVPIFTPSLGRASTALLNLNHTGVKGLHVVVTTVSKMTSYMGAWQDHVIMALPDNQTVSRGMVYCRLKQFLHHNYVKNCEATPPDTPPPLPWALIMSDSCVMWRREERGDHCMYRSCDVSLALVFQSLSQKLGHETSECCAISIPNWSTPPSHPPPPPPSHSDLNHHFLLLNIAMTTDTHYRTHSYASFDVDFNLQLFVGGAKTLVASDFSVVRKHTPPTDTPRLHSDVTTVATSDVDSIAVSLHDSVAPLFDYPGPYLLEHYLRLKSSDLFPSAHSPIHPVLVVDHYVNLGPSTHISFVPSSRLHDNNKNRHHSNDNDKQDHTPLSEVKFGGLLLYLCEGRISLQQLRRLNFVGGACLCLVTESSGSLVREVGRLDLEDRWKFRLRDEYKTACPESPSSRPLFFLIGHFGL